MMIIMIYWSNICVFSPFYPPQSRLKPFVYSTKFGVQLQESLGYSTVKTAISFDALQGCDRQTDGRTHHLQICRALA